RDAEEDAVPGIDDREAVACAVAPSLLVRVDPHPRKAGRRRHGDPGEPQHVLRSEEHTSELQSLTNLVCRLLLEKKKTAPPTAVCETLARVSRRGRQGT